LTLKYQKRIGDNASARISKGQGYQGFLKEKGREQFWSYNYKEKWTEFHYF
jgi:hypothetical protein